MYIVRLRSRCLATDAIARPALDLETILLDTMFDMFDRPGGAEKVVISKQVVEGTAPLHYIYADVPVRLGDAGAIACHVLRQFESEALTCAVSASAHMFQSGSPSVFRASSAARTSPSGRLWRSKS